MIIFSPSLKSQMKECILALLWPKKDIYRFFRDCSVPKSVLKRIDQSVQQNLTRAGMVDQVFDALSNQADNGTLQFDLILQALANWDHFDDYWFTTQQTLDLQEAKQKLARLLASKDRNIERVRKAATDRHANQINAEEKHKSLEEMRADFSTVAMGSATPQAKGYALERFLAKMARFFDLKVSSPFRINGTQIDGTIKYDGENYSIEAKWHHQMMSDEPILAFCHKQEMNMQGRGIFISINGYTEGALSMLERASIKNTVLMDGEDLTLVLSELISLPDLLEAKIHAAQTRGQFYIHPITQKGKF